MKHECCPWCKRKLKFSFLNRYDLSYGKVQICPYCKQKYRKKLWITCLSMLFIGVFVCFIFFMRISDYTKIALVVVVLVVSEILGPYINSPVKVNNDSDNN